MNNNSTIPTIFVVLGATGDLMTKKIVPALFNLHEKKKLPPKFKLLGVSRREWEDGDFRDHVRSILDVKAPNAKTSSVESFLKLTAYHKLTFHEARDYETLKTTLKNVDDQWGVCTNKLFYLSVPPQFYDVILENLHASGLTEPCGPESLPREYFSSRAAHIVSEARNDDEGVSVPAIQREGETKVQPQYEVRSRKDIPEEGSWGWTRVIIEKPFGSDEATGKALDARLAKLFKEEQIFRVDHYLGKEMLQNILAFRFENDLFEGEWNRHFIESINIRLFESLGVEDRGGFYDDVGALRDVGQNHLLQMLALVTMERPEGNGADAIRAARAALLETLAVPSVKVAAGRSFRAQYEGYRKIKGVAAESETETYFRITGYLTGDRWSGVPIVMESGKRLGAARKEIEVVLRGGRNRIVIELEPKEGIEVTFSAKKPGLEFTTEERSLEFDFRETHPAHAQYTEEYQKLILDCVAGDQTLFVSSEEIAAMWRFTDPFIVAWKKDMVPLQRYVPDSPLIADEAAATDAAKTARRTAMVKEIGIVGLGKMGVGLARQWHEKGWRVVAYNRHPEKAKELEAEGIEAAATLDEFVSRLSAPRVVWLMVTAGRPVDDLLFGKDPSTKLGASGLAAKLKKGDIVVDGGNSFFEDSMRRAKLLAKRGIKFLDAGVSGGPAGARHGACMMIGGDGASYEKLEQLFADASVAGGYTYFGKAGAGHFVKMVHNGIEYGMMQSIAEGFALMKKSPFKLNLQNVAQLYNRGSVIESRLVGWLESGYRKFGEELKAVSGSVAYTGEGEWTVKTGKKWKMKLPVIEDSFKFRVRSKKSPSYMGKILSALRNQFGGHSIEKK
ncbi:MAG: decarboxylating 6-phosphogluconate dehydrogenase [Minisyncoccia bacterium]